MVLTVGARCNAICGLWRALFRLFHERDRFFPALELAQQLTGLVIEAHGFQRPVPTAEDLYPPFAPVVFDFLRIAY